MRSEIIIKLSKKGQGFYNKRHVIAIIPNETSGWLLSILDTKSKFRCGHIVCIVVYSKPHVSKINVQGIFKGPFSS